LELSLLVVFIGGNKSSRERKFQGANVPHLELSLPGANGLGGEKSIIQLFLGVLWAFFRMILSIIIIIIIIIGFSVYLHNSPGDITQFNNKSMQKTEKF